MEKLQPCRNCGTQPRIRKSLYCQACTDEMASFTGASQRRAHAPDGELCWCPDCTMSQQREFRHREAHIKRAREQARAARRPPDRDPDSPGPRAA